MNWKYGLGLTLAILGAFFTALVWWAIIGIPLYIVGIIFILISGKTLKTKLLGILLPLFMPAVLWVLLWLDIII